jgi:hypothetical protein
MRNGRKQNAEVGMRKSEWKSLEQRTDGRRQSFELEFGMRNAERKKGQSFEFGFRIWDSFDFRFQISDFGFL